MGSLLVVLAAAGALLTGCSSSPAAGSGDTGALPAGCVASETGSGAPAVLVGAPAATGQGQFVTDLGAWNSIDPLKRLALRRSLAREVAQFGVTGCVQTSSALHVAVSPPARGPRPVRGPQPGAGAVLDGLERVAPPAGCHGGPHGTTECDTLFGFGQGTTPFTVSGNVSFVGNPVCVSYVGGRLCNGFFGAWGADGTPDNGNTGSGIGTSALAVVTAGNIEAAVQSAPTALYASQAPAGQSSNVSVRSYATLLDLTVQTTPESAQCAPTKITNTIVTPQAATPQPVAQWPISCVDEVSVDSAGGTAGASGAFAALLGAQQLLGQGHGATALRDLSVAASAAHQTLVATPHRGLPTASERPGDAAVLGSACPLLQGALAPGISSAAGFACTQSDFPVWQGAVPGQSVVSSQLATQAIAESAGGAGVIHLVLAFDTVDVHECWPAASCR